MNDNFDLTNYLTNYCESKMNDDEYLKTYHLGLEVRTIGTGKILNAIEKMGLKLYLVGCNICDFLIVTDRIEKKTLCERCFTYNYSEKINP